MTAEIRHYTDRIARHPLAGAHPTVGELRAFLNYADQAGLSDAAVAVTHSRQTVPTTWVLEAREKTETEPPYRSDCQVDTPTLDSPP